MTHDEALDVLTAWIVAGGNEAADASETRRRAQQHVASCHECWDELRSTHALVVGSSFDAAARMPERFGCEDVRPQLYVLVGLRGEAIAERHPSLARHLAWCHGCRSDLADLADMENIGEELEDMKAPLGLPERVVGAVQRLVIAAREGFVRFVDLPANLVAVPIAAPAGAWRADRTSVHAVSGGEHLELDLAGGRSSVRLTVEPQESGRVRLSLSLRDASGEPIDVTLREVRTSTEPLLAAQSAVRNQPFVVEGLRVGRYAVDVSDGSDGGTQRIELQVVAHP